MCVCSNAIHCRLPRLLFADLDYGLRPCRSSNYLGDATAVQVQMLESALTSSSHSGLMLCMRGTGVMMLVLSFPKLLSNDAWSTTSSSLSATSTCAQESPRQYPQRSQGFDENQTQVAREHARQAPSTVYPTYTVEERRSSNNVENILQDSIRIRRPWTVNLNSTHLELSRSLEVVVSSEVDAHSRNLLALWLYCVLLGPEGHVIRRVIASPNQVNNQIMISNSTTKKALASPGQKSPVDMTHENATRTPLHMPYISPATFSIHSQGLVRLEAVVIDNVLSPLGHRLDLPQGAWLTPLQILRVHGDDVAALVLLGRH